MAIQKNLVKEELGGLVITGAYHRIHSINLVFESDPKPTGLDEQHSHVGEELRLECNWETFANSGIRYSDPMTIEGGGMEIPISSLSGVTDKNSLLTMCYGHLKTGELSGGIDV